MLSLAAIAARIGGRLRSVPLARRIILLTIVLLAAVYASSALILTHYYEALSARQREARQAKAQLLAEHAGRALAAVDLSLETIAEALKARPPLARPTVAAQRLLDKYKSKLPQVRALYVADAQGRLLNTSLQFPPPKLNVSDRQYFVAQRKGRGVGLYLGRITVCRADHKPFFAMSRPILDDDGHFRGIVVATTDPQYFASFYDPPAEQMSETVLLERGDGAVLASAGMPSASRTAPGHPILHRSDRTQAAIAKVRGFPARIILIDRPIFTLPQFVNFLALDFGLLIVMTAMGVYLAATAAREAALVDREAQARRTAEARLLSAIESVPAGFALYDRDDRLVLSNDLYRSFFARGEDWMKPGKSRRELREAAIAGGILIAPGALAAGTGSPPRPAGQDAADQDEPTVQLHDGRWLLMRQRWTKDGDTVVFFSDITSLKQHQEKLERLTETQRLFVDALEHIPTGLMLCDSEDRLVFCNSATRRYFPNVAELLVPGTPFETLVRAQVGSQYLPSATADPEQWITERMAQHRAGATDAVRAYADGRWAQIVERHTESGCTIGIRTDITEIKQTEEALRQSEEAERAARQAAEQANQTKNAFLAHMSHELRTPLNAIIGFSEMIALRVKGPLPEIYRHYGEIVCASGRHLLSIISDMLDIAKLNAGKTELNLEPVDVSAIVREAVSMVSEKADNVRVHIALALAARCPEIEADEVRLRQVLLNLLSNAIKFTPAGGRVEVSTAVGASDLRIAVSDTGVGMAPEDIPRALEPFTQVGNNGSAAREGTGLGLPISKSLIVLHGGRFDIASAPTQGTTVTISLPLHRNDEPAAQAPALDVAV